MTQIKQNDNNQTEYQEDLPPKMREMLKMLNKPEMLLLNHLES